MNYYRYYGLTRLVLANHTNLANTGHTMTQEVHLKFVELILI